MNLLYKLAAEFVLIIHFLWILFMIGGVFIHILSFLKSKVRNFFLIRSIHLVGILYVSALAVLDKYCPLTILEYELRKKFDPTLQQPDSFIIYHLERIVYPEINPKLLTFATVFIGILSVLSFILKPPKIPLKGVK